MKEPSVLDYLKSKLMPWRGEKIEIPEPEVPVQAEAVRLSTVEHESEPAIIERSQSGQAIPSEKKEPVHKDENTTGQLCLPWRSLASLALALAAQSTFEPPRQDAVFGIVIYMAAAAMILWAIISKEWKISPVMDDTPEPLNLGYHPGRLAAIIPVAALSFLLFGGNRFGFINLVVWFVVLGMLFYALWQRSKKSSSVINFIRSKLFPPFQFRVGGWTLLLLAAGLFILFFRFYQLGQVPGEMFSDHAEKLMDVSEVLNGQYSIFFPRNTGREFLQMYLTAAVSVIFGTGLSYMSLKIGTAICGILTLPYIYLLGKEVGGRWVGLLALLLAGIGYWPNLIARIGLRFPLYPLFVAPVLYYLVRGLRNSSRNDFLLSGLFLGLGLNGYSPMRIVPFVVVLLIGIYLLHSQARGKRQPVFWGLFILAFASLIIFLPLGRYSLENPEMFVTRAFSRLAETETSYSAPVWQIFLDNLWKVWIMPFWDNGSIWVHSVVSRPALDVVSAALYFLGSFYVLVRYIKHRHWMDLFLLLSVPLFMLPSMLSLAFPGENPSLNRTGGAYIPVFILAAVGLQGILTGFNRKVITFSGKVAASLLGCVLLLWSAGNNYDLVFNQFNRQFMQGAWNTTQIGQVISGFAQSVGSPDSAFVIPFPHWVDTRLVGINAGYPLKDYALNREKIIETVDLPTAKLFIFKPEDKETDTILVSLYPQGFSHLEKSTYEGKDFVVFMVPPEAMPR